ncbi:MAG: MBOAT family O-acyltransferase [Chloroflexota bacterium]
MSFISFEYIVLLAFFVPMFFWLPHPRRVVFLLLVSYLFYAFARVEYLTLILFSTVVDYFVAQKIAQTNSDAKRKRQSLLLLSIGVNLGVLFFFKYFNFFSLSAQGLLAGIGLSYDPIVHNFILPVGISFYTFQSMAYTIDVYRGKLEADSSFSLFATYVAMFPQLVAGPIERAQNILPQLRTKQHFDYDRAVSGLQLILWGVFKKVVIADRLAVYVNDVYNNVEGFSGLPLVVATFFFTFQIYCDFSGYSDIAIGSAHILGYDLMDNFRQPYFSHSIRDFWRRWHISLSTWFRDYVYIPLGGNRVSFGRNLVNLMIVFVISGLWHGANWTFVIWGALHGAFIVIETIITQRLPRFSLSIQWLQWMLTFGLVAFAWLFFRANSLPDAWYIITHIFDFSDGRGDLLRPFFNSTLDVRVEFLLAIGGIFLLLVIEWMNRYTNWRDHIMKSRLARYGIYYAGTFAVVFSILLIPIQSPFIYFQF